ncbi:WG repeat-containing protein [Ruminococcus bromii]|jgi:tetratricopeptide (TPR) repeat protein|nr:WG repeat-containing protein [Ruminococcus bromii]
MKNYRKIIPLALVVLMALACYSLVSNAVKENSDYNHYLSEARKYAELDITKYAIENYNKALSINPTPDVYVEVAEYYERQENSDTKLLNWCEDFFEKYPTNSKSYDCILKAYMKQKDYDSCFDVLSTAEKRNVSSEYIKSVKNELSYTFKLDFNTYDDVGIYGNGFCAVKSKDAWGYVDSYGNQKTPITYVSAAPFTKAEMAPVVDQKGECYFIDNTGSRVLASKEKCKSFGISSDDIIKVELENGKYSYCDSELNKLFGEYDDATAFNNGIAAVKENGQWKIINNEGNAKSSTEYADVVADEKNIVFRNDRLFVGDGTGYIMIDSSGKQIGNEKYENAHCFADSTYAAVENDGKWFFIDKNAKRLSDKTYEDARSYSNGLAAVKISGKWGFVDTDENVVIEQQFFGAKDFSEKGSCFVQTGDKWQLLKLYRLNREE